MEDYGHIAPDFRAVAAKEADDRIAFILQDRWIGHPRADEVLGRIRMAQQTYGRGRPLSLLIVGESGIGKTMIRTKYQRDQRVTWQERTGVRRQPVLSFQMPPEPLEAKFFKAALDALDAPAENFSRTRTVQDSAVSLLRLVKVELLMVDEIQNVFAGTARQQRLFLNNLRWLINELRLPIVVFGTVEALDVFGGDDQLQRRFQAVRMVNWFDDLAGFKQFVVLMERTLPLRKSGELGTGDALKVLLEASEGITSNLCRLIEDAAVAAIRDGDERVTVRLLREIVGRHHGAVA